MNAFYYKIKREYLNSKQKDFTYFKLQENGIFIVLSMSKRTISMPKNIAIPSGYEKSTKEEFDEKMIELGF
jgi:hypothetical protein